MNIAYSTTINIIYKEHNANEFYLKQNKKVKSISKSMLNEDFTIVEKITYSTIYTTENDNPKMIIKKG